MGTVNRAVDDMAKQFFTQRFEQIIFGFKVGIKGSTAYISGIDDFLYRYLAVAFL